MGPVPTLRAEPGDVVGMHETLAGTVDGAAGPRRLTVAESGAALRIDRDDLFDLLGQRPDLQQQIFSALFGKTRPVRVRKAPPSTGSEQAFRAAAAQYGVV